MGEKICAQYLYASLVLPFSTKSFTNLFGNIQDSNILKTLISKIFSLVSITGPGDENGYLMIC